MSTSHEHLFSQQPGREWLAVALLVITLHLGVILCGISFQQVQPKGQGKTKVLVQTVNLNPSPSHRSLPQGAKSSAAAPSKKDDRKEIAEAAAPAAAPAKSEPKVVPKPVVKKSEEKKPEVKKAAPKSPPPVKKSAAAAPAKAPPTKSNAQTEKKKAEEKGKEVAEKKRADAKAEAERASKEEKEKQEKLATALGALGKSKQSREKVHQQSKHAGVQSIADLKAIGSLEIDVIMTERGDQGGSWEKHEIDYRDGVGNILKSELKLPEYGAVTIRLTLNPLGKVVKVEVVDSQSAKNRAYVEKSIPMLSFPPLGQQFRGESQWTFSFILKNHS